MKCGIKSFSQTALWSIVFLVLVLVGSVTRAHVGHKHLVDHEGHELCSGLPRLEDMERDDAKVSEPDLRKSEGVDDHIKKPRVKCGLQTIEFNKIISISSVAYSGRKLWTCGASRHAKENPVFPDRHSELLVGPAGDDRIMGQGAGFFVIKPLDDSKKVRPIRYREAFKICSCVSRPNDQDLIKEKEEAEKDLPHGCQRFSNNTARVCHMNGSYNPLLVWVARQDNRYVGGSGRHRQDDCSEIIVMEPENPEASDPDLCSFIFVNADNPEKEGAITNLDNVYIVSKMDWEYGRPEAKDFVKIEEGRDPNVVPFENIVMYRGAPKVLNSNATRRKYFYEKGFDKRLWVAPESRYGKESDAYEVIIGDGYGMGTQQKDRSLEFGKFKIEIVDRDRLNERAKTIYDAVAGTTPVMPDWPPIERVKKEYDTNDDEDLIDEDL